MLGRTWLTLGLLLGPALAAAQDGKAVALRDDFAADSRKQYQIRGEVAWEKGALTLEEGAALGRSLPLGPTSDVLSRLEWPRGSSAVLKVRLGGGKFETAVNLRRRGTGVELTRGKAAPLDVAPDAGASRWLLRVHVGHGLVRARAWHAGAKEPASWNFYHAAAPASWQPAALRWEASAGALLLTGVTVTSAPREEFAPTQVALLQQAGKLGQQAGSLHRQGKGDEALARLDAALKLYRRVLPEAHPLVARVLSTQGLVLAGLERWGEAGRRHEQALKLRRATLPPEHPEVASDLFSLGAVATEQGDPQRACRVLEEALAILGKVYPPDHPNTARALTNLAVAEFAAGQWEQAYRRLYGNLPLLRRLFPAPHPDLANSLLNLGSISVFLGLWEEGSRWLDEALAMRRQLLPDPHPLLALALTSAGVARSQQGRLDEGRRFHEQALAMLRRVVPEQHPAVASVLFNLGATQIRLGQLEQAHKLLEDSLARQRKLYPGGHPLTAATLGALGTAHLHGGRFAEAGKCLQEALAIRRQKLPPGHPETAALLTNLSLVFNHFRGHAEAIGALEEALAIQKKSLPPQHPDLTNSLTNLGIVYSSRGELERAGPYLEQALELRKKGMPAQHPDIAHNLINLSALLAWKGERGRAWELACQANDILAAHQRQLLAGLAQRDHGALVRARRHGLNLLLSLAENAPSLTPAQREELLHHVLQQKALSLYTQTLRQEAVLLDAAPATRALYGQLKEARQQLANLSLRGPGVLEPARYRRQWEELRQRQDGLEQELGARVAAFAALRGGEQPSLAALAATLPADGVLIEWVAYQHLVFDKEEGGPSYAALVLGRDGGQPRIRVQFLGRAEPLDEAIRAWRRQVQQGEVAAAVEKRLRDRVWAPLASLLPASVKRLLIAPDGQLALVPFEALRLETGDYLVERFSVRYLTTARDLLPRPSQRVPSQQAVIVSDPAYDLPAAAGSNEQGLPTEQPRPTGLKFRSLVGFAREAGAVAGLLRQRPGWKVDQFQGEKASEEAVIRVVRPRLCYFITHGFFLSDLKPPRPDGLRDLELTGLTPAGARPLPGADRDPRLRSGLALAGANHWLARGARGQSDGLLTALEVENLDLHGTELVVLSACETGLGAVQVGEGVLGLRRAFQLAGARSVVASLWKVPDAETEQLMTGFFKRWLGGTGKAEALRAAQLDLIRALRASASPARRSAPPLYWAGFICHGQAG